MWKNLFLVAIQFAINVQIKYLTNKFCLWISFHKLYKNVFSYVFTLKYVSMWDEFKKT
jgi:hypothetical protein